MFTLTTIAIAILSISCTYMIFKITKQNVTIFDLKRRLNISDREYISLFDTNIQLSEEIENLAETSKGKGWYNEENESRMNIIGQNGNEGTHYEK